MHIIDIGTLFGFRPASDLDLSPQALLETMDRNGVDEALTCSLKGIQYNFAAGNDETLALCREHSRLHPVAVVDPRQTPDCFAEVERCAGLGFVAFRLMREYQGWAMANRSVAHLLRAIAQTGLPALVHCPASGDATALYEIAGEWGSPVVLAAIGYATLSEALAVLRGAPHFRLEAHRIALPGQVELMVETVGPERLLFGSWAPWFAQRPSMDMILESEIEAAQKAQILSGNAQRLFRLAEKRQG